jgi:uncharacterized protein (TIGR02996 family)
VPDDPAFIRAIAASPDDDAPRLIYADYLDETGDPAKAARAEFIRVQIEKARLVPDSPRWTELWHRDTTLLEWARQWRAELPAIRGVQYGGFLRGFIDCVEAEGSIGRKNLSALFDAVPIRRLRVTLLTEHEAAQIAGHHCLEEIREIDVFTPNEFTATSVVNVFAKRGPWPRLRRIKLPSRVFEFDCPHYSGSLIDELQRVFYPRLFT